MTEPPEERGRGELDPVLNLPPRFGPRWMVTTNAGRWFVAAMGALLVACFVAWPIGAVVARFSRAEHPQIRFGGEVELVSRDGVLLIVSDNDDFRSTLVSARVIGTGFECGWPWRCGHEIDVELGEPHNAMPTPVRVEFLDPRQVERALVEYVAGEREWLPPGYDPRKGTHQFVLRFGATVQNGLTLSIPAAIVLWVLAGLIVTALPSRVPTDR